MGTSSIAHLTSSKPWDHCPGQLNPHKLLTWKVTTPRAAVLPLTDRNTPISLTTKHETQCSLFKNTLDKAILHLKSFKGPVEYTVSRYGDKASHIIYLSLIHI